MSANLLMTAWMSKHISQIFSSGIDLSMPLIHGFSSSEWAKWSSGHDIAVYY